MSAEEAAVEAPVYRFTGRATGSDPEGYYYPKWHTATPVSVLASTSAEATTKALAMLGIHPRFGRPYTIRSEPVVHGWAIQWDRIDEEAPSTPAPEDAAS